MDKATRQKIIKRIIIEAGGATAFARLYGRSLRTAQSWLYGTRTPREWQVRDYIDKEGRP